MLAPRKRPIIPPTETEMKTKKKPNPRIKENGIEKKDKKKTIQNGRQKRKQQRQT